MKFNRRQKQLNDALKTQCEANKTIEKANEAHNNLEQDKKKNHYAEVIMEAMGVKKRD